jgi:hypothetical protein
MNTPLDGTSAWLWFPECAEYKDKELRLVLSEGAVSPKTVQVEYVPGTTMDGLNPIEISAGARRILVHFEDVKLLHILDEVSHKVQSGERREAGVLAKHHNSALLQWVAESTKLIEMAPGQLFHYSVETAEDFYHLVTRVHPTVVEIEA